MQSIEFQHILLKSKFKTFHIAFELLFFFYYFKYMRKGTYCIKTNQNNKRNRLMERQKDQLIEHLLSQVFKTNIR